MRQRLKISGAFLNEATRILMLIVAVEAIRQLGLFSPPALIKSQFRHSRI